MPLQHAEVSEQGEMLLDLSVGDSQLIRESLLVKAVGLIGLELQDRQGDLEAMFAAEESTGQDPHLPPFLCLNIFHTIRREKDHSSGWILNNHPIRMEKFQALQ